MDNNILLDTLLNGQTKEGFIALLIYGYLGLIISLLIELMFHSKKIKKTGGFKIRYYFKDNIYRLIISILSVVIGATFTEDIIGVAVSLKGAFILGLASDKVIQWVIKLKKTKTTDEV